MKLRKLYITEEGPDSSRESDAEASTGADELEASEPEEADEAPADPEVDEETEDEAKPNKITRVVDTVLKTAGGTDTLGDVALKAFLFLVSVIVHSALSKSVSARLLKPGKGAKVSALARRRRFAEMVKKGKLKGEAKAAVEESIANEDKAADAVARADEAGVEDDALTNAVVATIEHEEEAAIRAENGDPIPPVEECEKLNQLSQNVFDAYAALDAPPRTQDEL